MIPALCGVAYGLMGVAVARFVYGRMRRQAIKDFGVDWSNSEEKDADFAFYCIGVGSILSVPLWPISLVLVAVFCNPPKTNEELEAERDEAVKKLEEMERNAGLR